MALRKALMMIGGLRRQVDDVGEDVMTRKILDELDVSGWEITQKAGREAGFVIDPPTVPTARGTRRSYGEPELSASGVVFPATLARSQFDTLRSFTSSLGKVHPTTLAPREAGLIFDVGQFEPGISLYSVFMTGNDCRKRAEAARQAATRHRRDRDIWLLIAEKYDRLADDLDRLDTWAFKKVSTSTNAEQMS